MLIFSVLFSAVEKKIFIEIMHFHYMTYGHALAQEPLPKGSWNLQFWLIILIPSSLLLCTTQFFNRCPGVERKRKICIEIHQFYMFTPKFSPLGMRGAEIYKFSSPYSTNAILVKIGLVYLEKISLRKIS